MVFTRLLVWVLAIALNHSVSSQCSIKMAGWIKLVFGTVASFRVSYTELKGNSGIFKNKGTSLWNFHPNSRLRKFCFGISIVEMCYWLSLTEVDTQSMINWTIIGQLSWQYLRAPTPDHCSLSQVFVEHQLCLWSLGSISDSWYLYVPAIFCSLWFMSVSRSHSCHLICYQ